MMSWLFPVCCGTASLQDYVVPHSTFPNADMLEVGIYLVVDVLNIRLTIRTLGLYSIWREFLLSAILWLVRHCTVSKR
jgi:hypothetical protein